MIGDRVSESGNSDTFSDDTFLPNSDTNSLNSDTSLQSVTTVQKGCNQEQNQDETPRRFEIGDFVTVDFPGSKRHCKTAQIRRLKTIQNCEMADVLVEGEKRVWEVQIAWLKPQTGEQKTLFTESDIP